MRSNRFEIVLGVGFFSLAGILIGACSGDNGGSSSSNTTTTTTSGGGGGDACGPGTTLCGDSCVATSVDPANCGACDKACGAGEACDNGSCVFECNGGATNCGGSCIDMMNDPAHCGACDKACDAAQEVCSAGQCVATCGAAGVIKCDGVCVDTKADAENCGKCNNPCGATASCVDGACMAKQPPNGVYTASNDPSGNYILAYERAPDGSLTSSGTFTATGGKGTGSGLGNQHGLIFDPNKNLFFVVNAGDNSISMLSLNVDGSLELLTNVPSGGERPLSVTVYGDTVYALNAGIAANGTSGNVTGFKIVGKDLNPIAASTQPLSAANPNPAQIQFTPDGKALVVAEKGTNSLSSYTVDNNGVAKGPMVKASAGMTPFGFDFSVNGQVVVSEAQGGMAGASTISSYSVGADGSLTTITGALASTRSAACWLVVAGDHAYVANAASNDITALNVAADGALSLLAAGGIAATAGKAPVDEDVTDDNTFLYVVSNGDHAFNVFSINADGSLSKKPDFVGIPSTASGIVAR